MKENIQKIAYDDMLESYTKTPTAHNAGPRLRLMRRNLRAILRQNPAAKILDIGCGDGEIFKDFKNDDNLFGVDISEGLLKRAAANGYKTSCVDIEEEGLPYDSQSFDVVITGETIEHIVNTDLFLAEINRVLKEQGKLIVSVPNINQPISLLMMALLDLPPRFSARFRSPHVKDFTLRTARAALRALGFKVLKSEGSGFYIPGLNNNYFTALAKRLPRCSSEIVFLCQKEKNVEYDKTKITKF